MSKYLTFFKAFLIFFGAIFFWYLAENRTDGFRTTKIFFIKPKSWNIRSLNPAEIEEINHILNQKFSYLKRGRQCFVFESFDQKYVLKFINGANVSYPSFLKKIPISLLQKSLKRKDERYPLTFSSIALAFNKLQNETGLIYVHLGNIEFNKSAFITNKYGQTFKIDLDKTCFILQKKATSFFSFVKNAQDNDSLKKAVDEFLNIIASRCKKNIADDDFNPDNIGFFEKKGLIIDTGKLYFKNLENKEAFKDELFLSTKLLRFYFKENDEVLSYLDQKMLELL